MPVLRLILDEARSATLNMAIDEMLLESYDRSAGDGVLRFYAWEEPSVTIGYFQSVEKARRVFDALKKDIPIVKRISGGGSVLHGDDVTFSLCLPVANGFFPTDVKSSYLKINEAVRVGLKNEYPAMDYADCRTVPAKKSQSQDRICFEEPACYDLLLKGKKVLGSSQRRIGETLLHQSTLFLEHPRETLVAGIRKGFEQLWKVTLNEKPLTRTELERAKVLEAKRYASLDWAFLRERSFLS